MKTTSWWGVSVVVVGLSLASTVSADSFGTEGNEFDIDFVTISGDTNPTSGYGIVNNDYRIGVFEITNDQWDTFKACLDVPVTGSPPDAYDQDTYFPGANLPTNQVSWYEAAQFVNYLNTSTGHHAAYNFTGTQGQSDYTFAAWTPAEADNGTNLYRHKDAFYYLPTEDEWVKAAYWNGISLQTWATPDDILPVEDVESNYDYESSSEPWMVGSGSEELNGTFDMMGNVWEWMENPHTDTSYGIDSYRGLRGGSCLDGETDLSSSFRDNYLVPSNEHNYVGFRVASEVPEPATLFMLLLGIVAIRRRR